MKLQKLITVIFLLSSMFLSGQSHSHATVKFNSRPIEKDGLSKGFNLQIPLKGIVEIGGHQFLNDTCGNPIMANITFDGVEISDSIDKYTYRDCEVDKCHIIHLERKTLYFKGSVITDTIFYPFLDSAKIVRPYQNPNFIPCKTPNISTDSVYIEPEYRWNSIYAF